MLIFPNAKINLGLNVIRKRADGFHDLETVFYPVSIRDALELRESLPSDTGQGCNLVVTGIEVDGSPADNICIKAWRLLRAHHPDLPPVDMHLHKGIPTGAGLGGGSADGAFMLKALDRLFGLGISQDVMGRYALQLGSDCPFFLHNSACYAEGRGERLAPLSVGLSRYDIVIVHPRIHVSTAAAFSGIEPRMPDAKVSEVVQRPVEAWRGALVNDFEKTVFVKHPEIRAIKERLYAGGALYASLTGTGSAVYGIFERGEGNVADMPAHYFIRRVEG